MKFSLISLISISYISIASGTTLQSVFDAMEKSQAVIEFDLNGIILKANKNFLDAMGYRLDEIVGKHHSMFVAPAYRDSAEYRSFWETLKTGRFHTGQFKRVG